jgi:ATP-binding cassette subfamily B protein
MLIIIYASTKFGAEFLNYMREVPFAYVAANAELHIATMVYRHIQHQSLAFHLSRETGKIIRIVSKGSQSFAQVLRFTLFSILPLIVEICFICGTIAYKYPQVFFWLQLGAICMYIVVTFVMTEWRAKYFKAMTQKDAAYVQKATDSLLNFETVKYFNAEDHEQRRFSVALKEYKTANVTVARTLVGLNMSQACCIAAGLAATLLMAYKAIVEKTLKVSDFIIFNTYIFQIYYPLGFLGTFWRFIRQSWTDVELVLDILTVDQQIHEDPNPIKADIHSG